LPRRTTYPKKEPRRPPEPPEPAKPEPGDVAPLRAPPLKTCPHCSAPSYSETDRTGYCLDCHYEVRLTSNRRSRPDLLKQATRPHRDG